MRVGATPALLLRRDRWLVGYGLAAATATAWAYQIYMAWGMRHPSRSMAVIMPDQRLWNGRDLLLLFVMWVVMMVAMMLPSAAPTVVAFATVHRARRERQGPLVPTGVFVLGYLAAWTAFSAAATLAQWQLHRASLVSSAMVATSPVLAGALLVASGAFQWTRLKDRCLSRCRSPLAFILNHWREGRLGALRMGLVHGTYCVGCCALLMALLFVNGVMNMAWMTSIAAFVALEKLAPAGRWTARIAGAVLCGWGVWVLVEGAWPA